MKCEKPTRRKIDPPCSISSTAPLLTCQLNRVQSKKDEFLPHVELKIWGFNQNTGKLGLYTLTDAVDTNSGERVLVLWCQEGDRVVYRLIPVSLHTPAANDNG